MSNTISRKIIARTGNEIMAEAMRQINPDVVAAYPITPATEIVQIFSSFVSNGQVDTEFIAVESEHSAMSACIGAASAGARVMTATSSQGLALMYEMLYIASGLRLPIILAEVNRTLSAPLNIHCDHSDTMGGRDAGWIQIFSENTQEAYDQLIQSVKIAENALLPAMVTTDGFIISHGMERVEIFEDEEVKKFIGEYKANYSLLNLDKPFTSGPVAFTDSYFEHKRSQVEAIKQSKEIIKQIQKEFNEKFGTNYDIFEKYCLEDAEIAIVVLGSTAGTTKTVINELRKNGIKAGMLKIRVFRPFYYEEIKDALSSSNLKAIAVLDRSDSGNAFVGPLCAEVKASLYESDKRPLIVNYVYGLGGRDVTIVQIKSVFEYLEQVKNKKCVDELVKYLGVKE